MEEVNLRQESARGQEASNIVKSDLWNEAMDTIKRNLLSKMTEYHSDPKACQEIALTMVVVEKIEEYFKTLAETGQMADYQLNVEAEQEARKRKLQSIPGALP